MNKSEKQKFIKVRCVDHGVRICATAALEKCGTISRSSWKLSGTNPEAKPSWKAAGPRSALALMILQVFNTPERRALARTVEPRIVRGAHLVRLHAKFNHDLGEHRNKHHVLLFRPDGDDSVRGARLLVFARAEYLVAFSDLPARVFFDLQVRLFLICLRSHYCGCPGSFPEAFPEAFPKIVEGLKTPSGKKLNASYT